VSASTADDITATLLAHAAGRPGAPVLSAPTRAPMTWGTLAQRIRDARGRLASWGIERGDVLAAAAVDRVECAAAIAILPVSSTFAALDPTLAVGDYVDLLRRTGAKAVLVPARGDHPIGEAARRLGIAEIAMIPDRAAEAGAFDLALVRATASLDAAPRRDAGWAYVGATSGTTGRPKLVPYGHRQALATSRAMGERLAMTPGDVSGHLTPLHLANGQRPALLLAMLNGGSVHCLPEADAGAFLDAVDRDAITYVSASFTIQRELIERLRIGRHVRAGRLRFLRVASGRLEPDEFARLEDAFGVPAITGLGTTEGGILVHQRLPPAPRTHGSVGDPLASEIRIVGDDGREVVEGEVGELQARGPQVFDGYLDDPALTAATFVDGWYRSGDLGRVDASGDVYLVGRATDVINRGGEKFAPLQIEAALRAIPGVADAAAFGVPHPRLGQEIVAAVVREPGVPLTGAELQSRARAALGPRRSPRRVWFVDAIPRNAAGKVLRQSLAAHVGHLSAAACALPQVDDARSSPLEAAIAGLWAAVLGRPAVGRDDDFRTIGGDAFQAARLVGEVRTLFAVEIDADAVEGEASTPARMARLVERAMRH